ncbi:unnamed protein product [Clonostachys chloroleuca]|uniref:Rhodopsin domain-containing protein n=1 Tax=Clonostachys chloroleuca TaxID=1926264 RepID=A0AA35PZL1_9HYPO|nr:unnamed protein product [Clonostachys chloroleuca]
MASLELLHLLPPEQQEAILNGPALEPPQNVIPNFIDPPNGNGLFIAILTVGLALSTLSTALRVYTKIFVTRSLQIEDNCPKGMFVGFAYCCYDLVINGTGFFVHQWNIQIKATPNILYLVHIASSFYAVAMGCLKVAILLEWTRIFSPKGTRGWFWYSCWALLIVNALFYTGGLIAGNLSCIPHQKIWNQTLKGHCINRKALDTATAAINIVSGLFILALPQKVIWSLKLSTAKKIGVSSVFAIGLFAVISAICRLAATIDYLRSPDATYYVSATALWCVAEQTCAILVFCVPIMPKAFKDNKYFRRLLTTARSSKNTSKDIKDWGSASRQDRYRQIDGGYPLDSLNQGQGAQGRYGSNERLQGSADGTAWPQNATIPPTEFQNVQPKTPALTRNAAIPSWEGGR